MTDVLLLAWIFAQAAASGVTPALVGGVVVVVSDGPHGQ